MVTDDLDDIVLDLIHQGMSGRDIAVKLGITIAREKTSVRRLKHMVLLSDRGYDSTDEREISTSSGGIKGNDGTTGFQWVGMKLG